MYSAKRWQYRGWSSGLMPVWASQVSFILLAYQGGFGKVMVVPKGVSVFEPMNGLQLLCVWYFMVFIPPMWLWWDGALLGRPYGWRGGFAKACLFLPSIVDMGCLICNSGRMEMKLGSFYIWLKRLRWCLLYDRPSNGNSLGFCLGKLNELGNLPCRDQGALWGRPTWRCISLWVTWLCEAWCFPFMMGIFW